MSEISKIEQNLIIKKIDNETVIISVNNNEMLMAIVGQFDQNLKNLSKLTDTIVFFRGNSITCKGDKEKINTFCEAIKFLINKYFLTNIIEKEDIVLSVKKNLEIEQSNVKNFKQLIKTPKKSVIARSEKQSEYIKALKENDLMNWISFMRLTVFLKSSFVSPGYPIIKSLENFIFGFTLINFFIISKYSSIVCFLFIASSILLDPLWTGRWIKGISLSQFLCTLIKSSVKSLGCDVVYRILFKFFILEISKIKSESFFPLKLYAFTFCLWKKI